MGKKNKKEKINEEKQITNISSIYFFFISSESDDSPYNFRTVRNMFNLRTVDTIIKEQSHNIYKSQNVWGPPWLLRSFAPGWEGQGKHTDVVKEEKVSKFS